MIIKTLKMLNSSFYLLEGEYFYTNNTICNY